MNVFLKKTSCLIITTFLFFPLSAFSQVLISKDEKLSNKLAVNYENGKAIIDIEKSDIKGVSHNYYSQFNVDKHGAVFNNSKDTNATLIVNEVTSLNKSILAGDISVLGRMANIIVANPNGIHCSDCSFNDIQNVTLINGESDKLNVGKYKISDKGNIIFSHENIDKHKFIFDNISLISKRILFMNNVGFYANTLGVINSIGDYDLFKKDISSGYNKGELITYKYATLNIGHFNYSAENANFINLGVSNIGEINYNALGKLLNLGELNLLSGRIKPYLDMLGINYPDYDFSKRNNNIKSTMMINAPGARFTAYNSNLNIDLKDGSFINKGYVRLEHTVMNSTSRNFIHDIGGTMLSNQSILNISATDNVALQGIIHNRLSKDRINIIKGRVISISKENQEEVYIRK